MQTELATLKPLSSLAVGDKGVIKKMTLSPVTVNRLSDAGISTETIVLMCGTAPVGDPVHVLIDNFFVALRKIDADKIFLYSL